MKNGPLYNLKKEEAYSNFGLLETEATENDGNTVKTVKPTIFANENIRIELREGYDKDFLKRIIEVLIRDIKFSRYI